MLSRIFSGINVIIPRNIRSLDKNNKKVGTGLLGVYAGEDIMHLQTDAKFKTFGPAITSSLLATEFIIDKSIGETEQLTNIDIAKEIRLPPVKLHCSILAEDSIKTFIKDYRKQKSNLQCCGNGCKNCVG